MRSVMRYDGGNMIAGRFLCTGSLWPQAADMAGDKRTSCTPAIVPRYGLNTGTEGRNSRKIVHIPVYESQGLCLGVYRLDRVDSVRAMLKHY